jgi:lysophospholipase L1-like esterase
VLFHLLPTLVGWLAIVVALDWALGIVLEGAFGVDEGPQQVATEVEGQIPLDPRRDSPAMAPYPWADEYFDELNTLRYDALPYVRSRLGTNEGRYINTTPEGRRSYEPDLAPGVDPVEIWFLGGSTMFGEGQRDEHTIPSEVARLAEADGRAVHVTNLAQQGLTVWQELLLFERELGRRPAPDVVVFYDGTNDWNAQLATPSEEPTHLDADDVRDALARHELALPGQASASEPDLWETYVETSAVHKVLRRVFGIDEADAAQVEPIDPTVVADLRETYLRMLDLAEFLAEEHGVRPAFFWQPVRLPDDSPYYELAAGLPAPVVDLTDALDDPPGEVYLDGGHTNELGARLVAEAMYPHLTDALDEAG